MGGVAEFVAVLSGYAAALKALVGVSAHGRRHRGQLIHSAIVAKCQRWVLIAMACKKRDIVSAQRNDPVLGNGLIRENLKKTGLPEHKR